MTATATPQARTRTMIPINSSLSVVALCKPNELLKTTCMVQAEAMKTKPSRNMIAEQFTRRAKRELTAGSFVACIIIVVKIEDAVLQKKHTEPRPLTA